MRTPIVLWLAILAATPAMAEAPKTAPPPPPAPPPKTVPAPPPPVFGPHKGPGGNLMPTFKDLYVAPDDASAQFTPRMKPGLGSDAAALKIGPARAAALRAAAQAERR